jgi:hypothetical protein
MPTVLTSASLSLLAPSGPVQACAGMEFYLLLKMQLRNINRRESQLKSVVGYQHTLMLEPLLTLGMSQESSSCCHILESPVVSVCHVRLWPASSAFIMSPEMEDISMILNQRKNKYGESW